jgi:glycosyltransferase involved in cell wall biosynthesis
MSHRLAIIIPAYKATFLTAALDSIAAQTCKDFTLYVGDDCSPDPIDKIVEQYRDKIELVYQRFDRNLGGKDLVAQWERCIAMSQDEPYIWLFSDDDVMEPSCVEILFKQIEDTKGAYDVYHFDVNEINAEGCVTKHLPAYPQVLRAYDYYKGKNTGRYRSYVVENVFSHRIYEQAGGFMNFDLAWGSDVATWCIFCGKKGMFKIPGAHVLWRRSSQNITPDKSRQIAERKLMSECGFLNWAYTYFSSEKDIWEVNRALFISKMQQYKARVGKRCLKNAFSVFFQAHGHKHERLKVFLLVILHRKLYKLIKRLL